MVFGTTPSLKQPATFCYSHSSENGECGVMGIIVTVFSQVAGFFFVFFLPFKWLLQRRGPGL